MLHYSPSPLRYLHSGIFAIPKGAGRTLKIDPGTTISIDMNELSINQIEFELLKDINVVPEIHFEGIISGIEIMIIDLGILKKNHLAGEEGYKFGQR